MKVLSLIALLCATLVLAALAISLAAPGQHVSVKRIPVDVRGEHLQSALMAHSNDHPAVMEGHGFAGVSVDFKVQAAPEGSVIIDSVTLQIPFGARAGHVLLGPPEVHHVNAAWIQRAVRSDRPGLEAMDIPVN